MKKSLMIGLLALFSSALGANSTDPSSATQTAKDDQGIGRVNAYLWSQDPSGPDRRVPGDAGGRLEAVDGTENPISGATTYALTSALTGTAS